MPRRRLLTAYGVEWPSIREQVFARDGRLCGCCGRPQSSRLRLQIHHIIPFVRTREHDLENLRPLCIRCHKAVHRAYNQHVCETNAHFRGVFAKMQRVLGEQEALKRRVRAAKRRASAKPKPPRPV